jgi:glutamate-5-semialdehyde dehydrogenase
MLTELGKKAKAASRVIGVADTETKNRALITIADSLEANAERILNANALDMENGRKNGMSRALLDRLSLTKERISGFAGGMRDVTKLPDPVGRTLDDFTRPNGLHIMKVAVPLGVIGIIFEARPNVTADAAALCLKSGNAVILRGGSDAINSNMAICGVMREGLVRAGLPEDCVQLVEDTTRESANALMRLNGYVDVIIPRGGAGLIRAVVENATVPVIETGAGTCHIYVDKDADIAMAAEIIDNAKTSRPSVCNAAECMLIHQGIAEKALPVICEKLLSKNVEIRGDKTVTELVSQAKSAEKEDWGREYNDYIIAAKVVDSISEAIDHINMYGTGHSECIVTENTAAAEEFMAKVDAAAVYHNASTRFTDGGEFGMGAEIGISTQKIHARGPLGLNELTSMKYKIYGGGQIR